MVVMVSSRIFVLREWFETVWLLFFQSVLQYVLDALERIVLKLDCSLTGFVESLFVKGFCEVEYTETNLVCLFRMLSPSEDVRDNDLNIVSQIGGPAG